MNNKAVAVIVVVAIAVIGFLFYRQNELENRLLQQQQQTQLESQKFQSQLEAKEKENETLRQAQQQVLDKIEAKDRAKGELQAEPFKFIRSGSELDVVRRGFLSTYSRATAVELTNNSQFDVSDVSGKLTYVNTAGTELATVPFTAEGDLPAGQSKKLKINATEVTGDARQGRILVDKVRIVGGPN